MNYILEIKAFYDWLEVNQLSTSGIALWHALMHIANKTGWQDTFTVATAVLSTKTGLEKQAIYRARAMLQNKGLISFKTRTGNQSAMYQIHSFASFKETQSNTQSDTLADTQTNTQTNTQSNTLADTINKQNKTKQNDSINPPLPPKGKVQQAAQGEEKTKQQQCKEIYHSFVFPPELQKKVNEWLRYKKEKRQSYQPTGLHRLLAQIRNECAKNGEQAVINVIDVSIANNYEGILWAKITEGKRGQSYGTNYGSYGTNETTTPTQQQQYGDVL